MRSAIRPETTVGKAIEVLTKQHIGGLPVINDDGIVVGMISELALIDVVFDASVKDAPVGDYSLSGTSLGVARTRGLIGRA